MPRLGYTKSRSGCVRCKQRRVKCDENVPCGACVRHRLPCSLLLDDPRGDDVASRQHSRRRPSRAPDRRPALPPACVAPADMRPLRALGPDAPELMAASSAMIAPTLAVVPVLPQTTIPVMQPHDPLGVAPGLFGAPTHCDVGTLAMGQLELMHHFTTAVYRTCPRGTELFQIWQTEVPRLSFEMPCLMHQILAIAAYHKAHTMHEAYSQRYIVQASQHQTEALRGLRALIPYANERTADAMFACGSLLVMSAFATFPLRNPNSSSIDGLAEVFVLIRGVARILSVFGSALLKGSLGKLLQQPRHETNKLSLSAVMDRLSQGSALPAGVDPAAMEACREEMAALHASIGLAMAKTSSPELRVAMHWPTVVGDEFLRKLRARHPAALLLLSHYAVVLHSAAANHWFLKGWGAGVVREMEGAVERWRAGALEWQLKCVGERVR